MEKLIPKLGLERIAGYRFLSRKEKEYSKMRDRSSGAKALRQRQTGSGQGTVQKLASL